MMPTKGARERCGISFIWSICRRQKLLNLLDSPLSTIRTVFNTLQRSWITCLPWSKRGTEHQSSGNRHRTGAPPSAARANRTFWAFQWLARGLVLAAMMQMIKVTSLQQRKSVLLWNCCRGSGRCGQTVGKAFHLAVIMAPVEMFYIQTHSSVPIALGGKRTLHYAKKQQ